MVDPLYTLLFIFEYQTADIPHILLEMNAPSNNIGKNNEKKIASIYRKEKRSKQGNAVCWPWERTLRTAVLWDSQLGIDSRPSWPSLPSYSFSLTVRQNDPTEPSTHFPCRQFTILIMSGEPELTGLARTFNSTTFTGRANVAKATYAGQTKVKGVNKLDNYFTLQQ